MFCFIFLFLEYLFVGFVLSWGQYLLNVIARFVVFCCLRVCLLLNVIALSFCCFGVCVLWMSLLFFDFCGPGVCFCWMPLLCYVCCVVLVSVFLNVIALFFFIVILGTLFVECRCFCVVFCCLGVCFCWMSLFFVFACLGACFCRVPLLFFAFWLSWEWLCWMQLLFFALCCLEFFLSVTVVFWLFFILGLFSCWMSLLLFAVRLSWVCFFGCCSPFVWRLFFIRLAYGRCKDRRQAAFQEESPHSSYHMHMESCIERYMASLWRRACILDMPCIWKLYREGTGLHLRGMFAFSAWLL